MVYYQLKYIDREDWTYPKMASIQLIDKYFDDISIEKIKLIFSDGHERIFIAD